MRHFVEALCRLMLRIFFRRVDVVGADQVPARGPLLIVANHPNGLMDPLVLLSKSPRPVSFMAKEPLFRMPLVSLFVKGLDCLPVYRKKDGADTSANRRTMEAARALMTRGGVIGLFPEGISHDAPQLQPLKTGAARMALAAQRLIADAGGQPLRIQPVGLYFEDKATFRSEAVIVWGAPIDVPVVDLDAAAEPSRTDTAALTELIGDHMRALTPEATEVGQIALAARVARLLAALEVEEGQHSRPPGMGRRLAIMQRLLAGHARAQAVFPAQRLQSIFTRIAAHERDLRYWRLPPDHGADLVAGGGPVRSLALTLASLVLLAPFSLVGFAINYPAYRLIGWLSRRYFSRDNDITSTAKTLGGLVLFPLSWAIAAGVTLGQLGLPAALLVLVLSPLCAFAALHFGDHFEALQSAGRSLRMMVGRRDRHASLLAERAAIRDELLSIEAQLGGC